MSGKGDGVLLHLFCTSLNAVAEAEQEVGEDDELRVTPRNILMEGNVIFSGEAPMDLIILSVP